jgi:hypothetical protein
MAKTHKYKSCECDADFSESRLVCTACGGSELTKPGFTESARAAKSTKEDLCESGRAARLDESRRENARMQAELDLMKKAYRIVEAYQSIGLSEAEARIAAGVEQRVRDTD